MEKKLKNIIKNLPNKPGVYRMINNKGTILYIGKAKDLKKRVSSYFHGFKNVDSRIQDMVLQISDIQITEVNSEFEALMLETNLIKENRPKYNILMKDDKNFVYIKINKNEDFPKIIITRKVFKDRAKYFGPKTSLFKVKATLKLLRNLFPFRNCTLDITEIKELNGDPNKKSEVKLAKKTIKVPCLYYHIKRCPGPCIGKISKNEYHLLIDKILGFLTGQYSQIEKIITEEMMMFANEKMFEKAAKLRDSLNSLNVLKERQIVTTADKENIDAINFVPHLNKVFFNIFMIRDGKLINQENFIMASEGLSVLTSAISENELITNFIIQYYNNTFDFPKTLVVPASLNDDDLITNFFKTKFNKNIKIIKPKIGKNYSLLEMSKKNAYLFAKKSEISWESDHRNAEKAMDELKQYLNLEKIPKRIECYDISHLGGTGKVGSMAVFENGISKKADYRRFIIKNLKEDENNDYASIQEVLERRLSKIINEPFYRSITYKKALKKDEKLIKKILKENHLIQRINIKDFLLAFINNKISGFARLSKINENCAEIGSLYVDPHYRGKHLGYELINELISRNKFLKFYKFSKKNLVPYYEKFGFKLVKQKPDFIKFENKVPAKIRNSELMILERIKIKNDKSFKSIPDLIVIDGGKGQLQIVNTVMSKYDLNIFSMGLAKENEDVFVKGNKLPLKIPKNSEAMYLLQRIRDEAHRFAITHQKIVRKHKLQKSILDTIPGVGEGLKKKLLRQFGSISQIKNAQITDITNIVKQKKLAERIKLFLGE